MDQCLGMRDLRKRLRQFKQFGVECLGISSSMADIEVISLDLNSTSTESLDKINLKINTLGDFESRKNYRILVNYLNDYQSKLSKDSLKDYL